MTSTIATSARSLRVAVVIGLIAAFVAAFGTDSARANDSGIFIACADANNLSSLSVGDGCTSFADALSAAVAFGSSDTIELMPGDYCPVTIPPDFNSLSLVGVGPAGLSPTNAAFSGPEAALSSFDLSGATCNEPSASVELTVPGDAPQEVGSVSLENLGFNGAAAGSPGNGISGFDVGMSMRDVLITNFGQEGIRFTADQTFINAQIAEISILNSAITNNGNGIDIRTGNGVRSGGSIYATLFAGNQLGVLNLGDVGLVGDTISHNATGVDNQNTSNSSGQSLNDIVADNTDADCFQDGAKFEPAGGTNGNNLITSGCATSPAQGDQSFTGTVAPVALVAGAPTPSIVPPSQAIGNANNDCGDIGVGTRTDQIEDLVTPAAACDIGSMQSANTTTAPQLGSSVSSVDAGSVPVNQTFSTPVYLGNSGGGLFGTSAVSVTGDSVFALSDDNCTYRLVLPSSNGAEQCSVSVSATPTTIGASNAGDLNVVTTAGNLDIPLTMTVVGPFAAPTNVVAVAGDEQATLSFTAPPNPTAPITGYDVQESSDGGTTWSFVNVTDDSDGLPTAATNLTNDTPYQFEIAAQDQYGDGPWSAPSAAVTPHAQPHATALTAPKAVTINDGQSISLATTLTDDHSHTPLSGATVILAVGNKTTGINAVTNPNGVATAKVHPTANTSYTWLYEGTDQRLPSTSASAQVTVKQVVNASISATRVKHGHTVHIYGTVSPHEAGKAVRVQEIIKGAWKTLPRRTVIKSLRLPGSHRKVLGFSYSYKAAKKGHESLRVVRAKTTTNAAGVSRTLTLRVI